jgi:hypothetical protein
MTGWLSISFIEEKVRDLENALFFSMSDSVLKIPACVVRVLETDKLGQLWFVIPGPPRFLHALDKTFPAKLDFFRKGRNYYLKILGNAFLVNDPEEINSVECVDETTKQQARRNESILVKVKIMQAEYVEKAPAKRTAKTWVNQIRSQLFRWFKLSSSDAGMEYRKIPARMTYPSITSFNN